MRSPYSLKSRGGLHILKKDSLIDKLSIVLLPRSDHTRNVSFSNFAMVVFASFINSWLITNGFFRSMPCLTGKSNSKIQLEIRLKILTRRNFCSEVKFRLRTTTFSRQLSVFKRCSIDRSITEKLQILAR